VAGAARPGRLRHVSRDDNGAARPGHPDCPEITSFAVRMNLAAGSRLRDHESVPPQRPAADPSCQLRHIKHRRQAVKAQDVLKQPTTPIGPPACPRGPDRFTPTR
jgi:hypothetical protein